MAGPSVGWGVAGQGHGLGVLLLQDEETPLLICSSCSSSCGLTHTALLSTCRPVAPCAARFLPYLVQYQIGVSCERS